MLSKWYYVPTFGKIAKRALSLSLSLSLSLPLISLLFLPDLRKEETLWRRKKFQWESEFSVRWKSEFSVRNEEEDACKRVGKKGNKKTKVVKFWFKN
jgi:hypothetical protein